MDVGQLLAHVFLGLVISYVAAIPLGPVNLAVFQTALERGKKDAFKIAIGSTIAEILYCLLAMGAMNIVFPNAKDQDRTILVMQILAVPLLLFLGIANLVSKPKDRRVDQKAENQGFLLLGLTLNISNVGVFALWTGVVSFLKAKGWIVPDMLNQWDYFLTMIFIFNVGLGTFLTHITFIYLTEYKGFNLTDRRKEYIGKIIGLFFIGLALYQAVELYIKFFILRMIMILFIRLFFQNITFISRQVRGISAFGTAGGFIR